MTTAEDLFAWARRIQMIAQAGLAYSRDPFDLDRFHQLRDLSADMFAKLSDTPLEEIQQILSIEQGYPTPKVDIRAVVFKDGEILMVKERSDGCWSLPGGWADIGESAGEIAVREVFEETGYHVRPVKLLAVFDRDKHPHQPLIWSIHKIFIQCELLGGTATTSIETESVGFFNRDALPELSTDRVTAGQIARMFMHLDNPALPADFD